MIMITGVHAIIYSKHAEKDRAFLRDVLNFPFVDVGEGWLIFRLPPAEAAIHPSKKNGLKEIYLMCDDIEETAALMRQHNIKCGDVEQKPWGSLIRIKLPGGGTLQVYQPSHESPQE